MSDKLRIVEMSSRYEVREQIGGGAMGHVFAAWDMDRERDVAIKVMRNPIEICGGMDPEHITPKTIETFRARFRREFKVPSSIAHQNIIPIYDSGVFDDGQPCYVMPLIEGAQTLLKFIRDHLDDEREPPVATTPVATVVELFRQAAEGLDALHANKLLHRDIKPNNIILHPLPSSRSEGRARLGLYWIDFGVLGVIDDNEELTRVNELVGSIAYIAPECFMRGGRLWNLNRPDRRSDLYALGATFYLALTGQHPYQAILDEHPDKKVDKAVFLYESSDPATYPKQPSALRKDIPPGVDSIVMKLIDRNPSNRYGDAAEVVDDLRGLKDVPPYQPPSREEIEERHRTPIQRPGPPVVVPEAAIAIAAGVGAPQPRRARYGAMVWLAFALGAAIALAAWVGFDRFQPGAKEDSAADVGSAVSESPANTPAPPSPTPTILPPPEPKPAEKPRKVRQRKPKPKPAKPEPEEDEGPPLWMFGDPAFEPSED